MQNRSLIDSTLDLNDFDAITTSSDSENKVNRRSVFFN